MGEKNTDDTPLVIDIFCFQQGSNTERWDVSVNTISDDFWSVYISTECCINEAIWMMQVQR